MTSVDWLITTEQAAAAGAAAKPTIPASDPVTPLTGQGATAQWADWFDTIRARSAKVVRDVQSVLGTYAPAITTEIETYVGQVVAVIGTQVNDLWDWLGYETDGIYQYLGFALNAIQRQLDVVTHDTTNLVTSNYEVREQIIPALLQQIAHLQQVIDDTAKFVTQEQQDWAWSNIFLPLQKQLELVAQDDEQQRQAQFVLLHQYTDNQVLQEQEQRIAAYLLLQQSVQVLQTEQVQCVEPMCSVMGPNTDLGKFLKALNFASSAALLYELANLTEDQILGLLGGFSHIANGAVQDFADFFVGGGETIAQTIAHAL